MRTRRPLPLLLALLTMLAALLAACGASSTSPVFSEIDSGLSAAAPTAPAAAREDSAAGAPAAMPTAAPAAPAEAPPAVDAPAGGGGSAEAGPPAPASGPERPVGQEPGLRAGLIDDNADFAAYLNYLSFTPSGVRPADVSERYWIRVLGEGQQPLHDAVVSIYGGEELLFQGRSYAGGELLFLPSALGVSPNLSSFRAVASYGQAQAEVEFSRGASGPIEIGLRGARPDDQLRLDLMFVLDTTGSMADELSRIQETIDEIASRIDGFTPRPQIRWALVAYRDEGDDYVTRSFAFSESLEGFRTELQSLRADGGGDTPEALDEALYEALPRSNWNSLPTVRLAFLVADAAPHIRAQTQFSYLNGAEEAQARGVKIYPIAASNTDAPAEYVFRQLAQQTMARFVFLTYQPGQDGGAPGESTTLEAGEQPYTVERLDDLIVNIVEDELAAAVGLR